MSVKVHVDGPNVHRRVETTREHRITVGAYCGTIELQGDPGVAPEHLHVTPTSTGLDLEPLEGGVRVGRDVVTGARVRIAYGDTVTVGSTRLRFQRDPLHFFPAHWRRPPVPVPVDERAHHDLQLALLVTIRDAPDDPAPPMVYADWLEAAGYLEEAEHVRHGRLEVAAAVQATWHPPPTAGPIVGCYELDCPGRLELLAPRRPLVCATCDERVRACASTSDVCAALAAGRPLAVDAALPRVTAELVDAAVRRVASPPWAVRRCSGEASWAVTRRRGRKREAYRLVMIPDRVELHFGGSEKRSDLGRSPARETVELPLAGLDDAALVEWLVAAFAQLPPAAPGYR